MGMSEDEISGALSFLQAQEKQYKKGHVLLHAGDVTERLGLVLEGSVTIESNDAWGNRTILSHVGPGQLFAETYALLEDEPLLVDVVANETCRILFLRVSSTQKLMSASGAWATKITANVLMISALKNLHLSGRSFHTAPKTVRGRVMAYLNTVSLQTQSTEFDIPFDRQQFADYGTDCAIKGTGKNAERRLDQSQEKSLCNMLIVYEGKAFRYPIEAA